jgi:hypothetical protein
MQNNQERIVMHLRRYYANELAERLRNPNNWQPVFRPPSESDTLEFGYREARASTYKLETIIPIDPKRKPCPTPLGDIPVPPLKIILNLQSYRAVLHPFVNEIQSVCPNHKNPYLTNEEEMDFQTRLNLLILGSDEGNEGKYLDQLVQPRCQHECLLGFILRSPRAPYREHRGEFKVNTEHGYTYEHHALLQMLLDVCGLFFVDKPTGKDLIWEEVGEMALTVPS